MGNDNSPIFQPAGREIFCQQILPAKAQEGIALFNAGRYFEAHEALEKAWIEDCSPGRDLYRGILQVAVAYYHILRGNYRGARKMLRRCRGWLAGFPDICQGVDVAGLRRDYETVEALLIRLGPQNLASFDPRNLKPLRIQTQP